MRMRIFIFQLEAPPHDSELRIEADSYAHALEVLQVEHGITEDDACTFIREDQ